jgi:hypothetical protein
MPPRRRKRSSARSPTTTAEGIEKYLGSGMVRGIGPKLARRIVAARAVATCCPLARGRTVAKASRFRLDDRPRFFAGLRLRRSASARDLSDFIRAACATRLRPAE